MLTEEQKAVHSEYRKYLRIVEGIKGNMLNTLVNATEKSLPTLIREHVRQDFDIRFYANKIGIDLSSIQMPDNNPGEDPGTDEEERQMVEGRLTEAKILRRQRNRAARQKCLEDSGYTCYVCGFNFEKAYGEIGKNFLEVHHTKPLATYDDEHPIPQSELCALCSNCHSMVHRKREVMDVDELKRLFESNNQNK